MKQRVSPLALRISLVIVLVIGLTGVLATAFLTAYLTRDLEAQFEERGKTLSLLLARLVNEGIAEENLDLVQRAASILDAPGVEYINVYNEFWDLIETYPPRTRHPHEVDRASAHFAADPESRVYVEEYEERGVHDFYARVLYQPFLDSPPLPAGFVEIDISSQALLEARGKMFRLHLGVAFLFCLLTILLLLVLLHVLVVRPVRRLKIEMELFGGDGVRLPAHYQGKDEISDLGRQFAEMADVIEERSQALAEKTVYLDNLLRSSSYGIVATDAELVIRYFNPRAEELYATRAAEVVGKSVWEIHRERNVEPARLESALERVRNGAVHTYVTRQEKAEGGRTLASSIFAIRNGVGEVIGFLLMVEDISERLLAQARLAASEARNRAVIEALSDGLVIVNREGVVEQWNESTAQLVGCVLSDLQGAYLPGLLFTGEARQRFAEWIEAELGQPGGGALGRLAEFTARRQDGQEVPVEVSLSPCVIGEQWHGVLVLRDISLRRKYIMELERSNQELEQFAYVASHDLQEPLRVVTGFVQLLEQRHGSMLDDNSREYMAFIVEAAARMKNLISDLLTYSRLTTRAKPLGAVALEEVLTRVMGNLALLIAESGAEITWDALPRVHADQGQMVQLFQNLLTNALRYRRPAEPPRVHVAARQLDREWVLSVADRGIGIEPRYFERIFKIFQRLHSSDEYPGTGIGLAICKKIVERHHGRIWVESPPGQGTTFYFTLPLAPPAAEQTGLVLQGEQEQDGTDRDTAGRG